MNKGIHTRGYLPHWDFNSSTLAITFRLADSFPAQVIKTWNKELLSIADDESREKELHKLIAKHEDAGHGEAVLRNPD